MHYRKGFTVIELLIVITIILLLIYLAFVGTLTARAHAKVSRVGVELAEIADAANQYAQDNGFTFPGPTDPYPADVDRGVPPGLQRYLAGGTWPTSIYPKGVFDWDSWPSPIDSSQVHQVTYHLCGLNDPISYCSDPIVFPHFTRYSSIFYCIDGTCVPHEFHPSDPGFCVNCKVKSVNPPL